MVFGFFNREIKQARILQTRILICTVADEGQLKLQADSDAGIYRKYYPNVTLKFVKDGNGLLELIKSKEFDAIHILANVNDQGNIGGLPVQEIHNACNYSSVRIVFWAANTPSIKHFKSGAFHLVMTLDRKGAIFGNFLDKLLSKMAQGKSMPVAWVESAPHYKKEHDPEPECVFNAGCGQMVFLP
jgi:hypothetical protein